MSDSVTSKYWRLFQNEEIDYSKSREYYEKHCIAYTCKMEAWKRMNYTYYPSCISEEELDKVWRKESSWKDGVESILAHCTK